MARERLNAAANLAAFATPQALAAALADAVAAELARAVAERGKASLAVSGGTTPRLCLSELSAKPLAWDRVTVTLVDDRFVPASSPRSNEGLARRILLVGPAAEARFIGLVVDAVDVERAAAVAESRIDDVPFPLDVAVLGMGLDGHTASFFPDAANLGALLDPSSEARVGAVHAPSAGEPRLTLTLPVLAAARSLFLHIEGGDKLKVLDEALNGGQPKPPIAKVIGAAMNGIRTFWTAAKQ